MPSVEDDRLAYVPEPVFPKPQGMPLLQIGLQNGKLALWHKPGLSAQQIMTILGKAYGDTMRGLLGGTIGRVHGSS